MALAVVNVGSANNDGTGDNLRAAMQKVNANFFALSDGLVYLGDPQFAAVGDGTADDTGAINAWYQAIPADGTGVIPVGQFRFTSPLVWDRNVNVIGLGPASCLKPDVGAGQNGITVGEPVLGSYRVKLDAFSICNSAANCCAYGIVLNRVQDSEINIHLEAACAQYQAWVNGCVIGYFRFVHSTNGNFPYTRGNAAVGTVRVTYDTPNLIGVNNVLFDVIIEGGPQGLVIEDQQGQGNIEIRGVIEGLSSGAYSLYAKGCANITIHDFHLEANSCFAQLENCANTKIGGGVIAVPGGNAGTLKLVGCNDTSLDGCTIDTLDVDSTSKRVRTYNFKYNVSGTGSIIDPSSRIVAVVPMVNGANGNNDTSIDASATTPSAGFFRKNDFVPNNNMLELGTAGNKYVITGFHRLTTGSAHAYGTDWIQARTLTGN